MIDNDNDIDYGSTIDRTIPNGTRFIAESGQEYIFNDGEWVSVEGITNISCAQGTKS